MKVNVIYNELIDNYKEVLNKIETVLIHKKVDFCSFSIKAPENYGEFTFVIGGDGTLLKAAKFYNAPTLGINLGRLGFLSQAEVEVFDIIVENVLENRFKTEERLMLESGNYLALNDFVIKGCAHSRTSKMYLEINEKFVCDYIADGLIISTPTGSTAYGLSAGGPVLYPTLDCIVIVPICPHTLNARPLVVPSSEKITIKTGDRPLSLAIDGFEAEECIDFITIKASSQKAKLAFLENNNFYTVLRNKLHWGISPGE